MLTVVEHEISYKEVGEHVCLSPPGVGVEQGSSKDSYVWNIIMYWNGKVDSL